MVSHEIIDDLNNQLMKFIVSRNPRINSQSEDISDLSRRTKNMNHLDSLHVSMKSLAIGKHSSPTNAFIGCGGDTRLVKQSI
jgi:hypothetical protein